MNDEQSSGAPRDDGDGGVQIRIDERKLMWGLVLVLVAAVAIGVVQLMRQADRIGTLEETVDGLQQRRATAGRGGQERMVIPGKAVNMVPRDGTGANAGAGARKHEIADEAVYLVRKERIDERLGIFQQEHALDDETAAKLETIIDESFANVQGLRQRARTGELDVEQRRVAFQEEISRRDTDIDALIGEELRAAMAEEVYKQRPREGAAKP